MMDTRDRADAVGKNTRKNGVPIADDGKSLLHDYITVEELRACTTCNACVQECPVQIEAKLTTSLDTILRYQAAIKREAVSLLLDAHLQLGEVSLLR